MLLLKKKFFVSKYNFMEYLQSRVLFARAKGQVKINFSAETMRKNKIHEATAVRVINLPQNDFSNKSIFSWSDQTHFEFTQFKYAWKLNLPLHGLKRRVEVSYYSLYYALARL